MNRIILIGNGFDLAHKMETSYNDFINSFWEKKTDKVLEKYIKDAKPNEFGNYNITYVYNDEDITITDIPIIYNYYSKLDTKKTGYDKLLYFLVSINEKAEQRLTVTNVFLERITKKTKQDWVDIEVEYYNLLLDCLDDKCKYKIEQLNKDFYSIQTALIEYLKEQNANKKNPLSGFTNLIDNIIDLHNIDKGIPNSPQNNTLFLTFNYTNTEKQYVDRLKNAVIDYVKCIHIHGELNNSDNPIVFGYGDELDDKYKLLESKNDNKLLENVKSIKYLKTLNYRELLSFINSQNYHVYIIGHSCGISDKTLLNTLFENEHCLSVKIFYHKIDEKTNNYSEVVKNISRNFKDKSLMRRIVVPYPECEPLSAISRLLPK